MVISHEALNVVNLVMFVEHPGHKVNSNLLIKIKCNKTLERNIQTPDQIAFSVTNPLFS